MLLRRLSVYERDGLLWYMSERKVHNLRKNLVDWREVITFVKISQIMAKSLHERIEDVGRNMRRIERAYRKKVEENATLREANVDLTHENTRLREELASARRDAEFLSMSHRLAGDPDSLVQARRRISGMIREIDRCISQLKE